MRVSIIILAILTTLLISINSKGASLEVTEEFKIDLEFITSSSDVNYTWEKRGSIEFNSKNRKTNKLNYEIKNEPLTKSLKKNLTDECYKDNSQYTLRFKLNNQYYYSTIETCALVEHDFNDKFTFSFHDGVINPNTLEGFSYEIVEDNNFDINKKDNNYSESNFHSTLSFIKIQKLILPNFNEPSQQQGSATGGVKDAPQEEPSFFRKYWYLLLIGFIVISSMGGAKEGGEAAQ